MAVKLWNTSLISEFRAFIMRGSVVDLAVGIIIGAAFTGVVGSLVKDVFNPILGLAIGGVDFSNLFVALNGQHYDSLADAQHAGAPTLNFGLFINAIINFLIIAFAGMTFPGTEYVVIGFGLLVVVQFLFGMGEAGAFPNITRALYNWFPATQRGSAQGTIWLSARFMGGLTPMIWVILTALLGFNWREVLWLFAGIAVLWCLICVANPTQSCGIGVQ
jgi:large conductance mechanosensitive channel protein